MGERTGKGNELTRLGLEQNKQGSKSAGTKVGDGTVFIKDTKLQAICTGEKYDIGWGLGPSSHNGRHLPLPIKGSKSELRLKAVGWG